MSDLVVVYVGLRPCGCRVGAIRSDAGPEVARVARFLKGGGAIQTHTVEGAAHVPLGCDRCMPVRQGALL